LTDPLFCTMDIGSGPRDPGLINLLGDKPITQEQTDRVTSFIRLTAPGLEKRYLELVRSPPRERQGESRDFLTQLAVEALQALGYNWAFDLEWPRTEMVDWERADVGGFEKSESWQHSYGYRFWKPSEISGPFSYANSDRHVEELARVARFAKKEIRFPITDAHCEVHANDNLYYYGRWLGREKEEALASLRADHEATMEFSKEVTIKRARELAKHVPAGAKVAIQYDNFIAACEEREYDKKTLRKLGFDAPSFIQSLKEITPSIPGVRYFIHNCLQDYSLYTEYLVDVPNVEKFCLEMSSHDTASLGTTDAVRKGPGFESLKEFKEYGLRKNQVVGVGVASTYEGAVAPSPELVRDRILYAVKVLDDPWKVQPVLDCGQRNLSLKTMYEIGVNVHRGRDLALKAIEKDYGIDATPYLTASQASGRAKG
jgi:5-methyltetrahydropteroyltriglutamate--homocysteine methyltransferase